MSHISRRVSRQADDHGFTVCPLVSHQYNLGDNLSLNYLLLEISIFCCCLHIHLKYEQTEREKPSTKGTHQPIQKLMNIHKFPQLPTARIKPTNTEGEDGTEGQLSTSWKMSTTWCSFSTRSAGPDSRRPRRQSIYSIQ